jgi:short-subunit dehydrogenase
MDLTGARILVTGASAGIGSDIARRLARAGAWVVAAGRDEAALADLSREIGSEPAVADLAAADGVARLVERATAGGDVDGVVNNAGIGYAGAFAAMPGGRVEALLRTNLLAPIELTRLLLPAMLDRGRGAVAFVTSIAGLTGVADEAVYSATKAGLSTFADSLRLELASSPVDVVEVAPGVVDTEFFARRGSAYTRPFPRPISADRVAAAVVSAMASGRARSVVPAWLEPAARIRGAAPGIYRRLAARFG